MSDNKQQKAPPVILGSTTPGIRLVSEMPDTVTLRRADFETLLAEIEDAEDRAALLEHGLAKAAGTVPEPLTVEEAESADKWREPGEVLAGEARADAACARRLCGDQPEPTCRNRERRQDR
jgi:hypothetical protein